MANTFTIVNNSTNEVLVQIDQGTDFGESLVFYTDNTNTTRRNLTGYTFSAKARYGTHASDTVVTFTTQVTDAAQGVVNWALTDTQTQAMKPGRWVFDLEMSVGGEVTRIMWGTVEIKPAATY
jgi:hypothetical protein